MESTDAAFHQIYDTRAEELLDDLMAALEAAAPSLDLAQLQLPLPPSCETKHAAEAQSCLNCAHF